MATTITIEEIQLQGFRAYLQPQSFHLSRGKTPLSLAIFAPNAKGKSSLIDAFEFYFSDSATLSRLGRRASDRNAGRTALENVWAQAHGVTPTVTFSFRRASSEKFGDGRAATPQGTERTAAANKVLANCTVPFIIRGHELRRFVEDQTSEGRYEEIVAWFGLQPLLVVQRNLRNLRRQVKQAAESTTKRQERLRDLARITGNSVTAWDEPTVTQWVNDTYLSKLDNAPKLNALSRDDTGYQELVRCKEAEDERLGLTSLKRILRQIGAIYLAPAEEGENPNGALPTFQSAVAAYYDAAHREAEERAKASQAVFHDVWASAKAIFENNELSIDACPVCDTKITATPPGSRDQVLLKLNTCLGELASYQRARDNLSEASKTLERESQTLASTLGGLLAALEGTTLATKLAPVTAYQTALGVWKVGEDPPDAAELIDALVSLHTEVSAEKARIEQQQGEQTYTAAFKIADDLISLKEDIARIDRTITELRKLSEQLDKQAHFVNKAITDHTENLIQTLTKDVNTLYKSIQGGDVSAPPVRLELPPDTETNQQRIQLVIDFAENRRGVVPSGYLSDSQIHTLALSLRLAAIRLFNVDAPIIVLDDVVTSYDSDHRKNIAAMLARHFSDYQIFIVTHEERFFALLQDHLPQNSWRFRRITELRSGFGPTFHDHRTPDEEIQARLDAGQSAANEIRQAEEEWLLDICRAFRVKVSMRPVDRAFKFDRSELAGALASFLKNARITPPQVPGIANPFLASLQKGDVENFGSHFSDNPNEFASVGDERTRWAEFTYFRDLFVCPNCKSNRFMRPEALDKPVCKKCQTPFELKVPAH